ncbi:MAG: apolipoprotein N-acyltransferase [Desulfobacula sp.]|nr:apolipoprotein N-acyltransferase [Desulfobacula sp.]
MIAQKNTFFLLKYFPALISGLALTLSFPATNLSCLAFFALIPWIVSIQAMTLKESFYSGFIVGLCFFLTLIYWIIPTVHVYGRLHLVFAISTLILLCFYLALYSAIFAFLMKKASPKYWVAPLFASCLWTGLEYIRTYAFTGFSWGALGYSQYKNIVLIQIADFSGVYGVSFFIVLVNYLLAVLWISFKKKQRKKNFIPVAYTIILVAGALFYGSHQINIIDSQIETAQKTTIKVVQGNIKQDLKWTAAFKARTIEKYIRLSTADSTKVDLVIWPETALPFYYGLDRLLSNQVDQCVRSLKTSFLFGSPAFNSDENKIKYYNRAYMLNRFSIVTGTYDKHHLVPFGEYVPFGDYLTFIGKLTAQAGNFSIGDMTFKPLQFNNHTLKGTRNLKVTHKTGVLICFEILFPSIASKFVKNGADILTTITNDAWFGRTSAALQHFSIAVFRAVENRRTIARAANTGISGFIDPKGKILETTALFKDLALTRQVPALNRISFYTKYGDIFAISSIVASCMAFMLKGIRRKFWS